MKEKKTHTIFEMSQLKTKKYYLKENTRLFAKLTNNFLLMTLRFRRLQLKFQFHKPLLLLHI